MEEQNWQKFFFMLILSSFCLPAGCLIIKWADMPASLQKRY
jgi:hypothetical protein